MNKHLQWVAAVAVAALSSGCVGMPMSLTSKTPALETSKQSLVLMSAQLTNDRVPACTPEATLLQIEDRNGRTLKFKPDSEGLVANRVERNYNRYLLRVALEPGRYTIRGITGICRMFPMVGSYFMPMHADVDVPAGAVVYLGRINALMRTRGEGDFRAGPVIPLIDQAAAGMSGGTWDVGYVDAYDEDLARMNELFPALKSAQVEKRILPAFDRQKAFEWWDAH